MDIFCVAVVAIAMVAIVFYLLRIVVRSLIDENERLKNVRYIEQLHEENKIRKIENQRRINSEAEENFPKSADFFLLLSFLDKFKPLEGYIYPNSDPYDKNFQKLKDLLKEKGWSFSEEGLKRILEKERKKLAVSKLKKELKFTSVKSASQSMYAYVRTFGSDLRFVPELRELLESEFNLILTISELEGKLKSFQKGLDIQKFEQILTNKNHANVLPNIDEMSGLDFENLLFDLFKSAHFQVSKTNQTGDFGADLIIQKHGRKNVIQAKRKSGNIGVSAIQEVNSAISFYGAEKGVVISNSFYTRAAIKLAKVNNIVLIDREQLTDMLSEGFDEWEKLGF